MLRAVTTASKRSRQAQIADDEDSLKHRPPPNFIIQMTNYLERSVPPNPPAKQFWSLTIYDTRDRVGIDNKTQNADVSSRDEGLRKNSDGSVDLYVGPTAPTGYEKNWLQTNPGKAWFAYFRLHGLLEPYLSRTWKLPD